MAGPERKRALGGLALVAALVTRVSCPDSRTPPPPQPRRVKRVNYWPWVRQLPLIAYGLFETTFIGVTMLFLGPAFISGEIVGAAIAGCMLPNTPCWRRDRARHHP